MRHSIVSLVVLAGLMIVAVRHGAADAPPGRYNIMNGGLATGTVLDTQTGLTWQQTVPATTYTWTNASTYCASNAGGLPNPPWRLPSMQELQTIVDDSRKDPPAIDPSAFPGTPNDIFWSSSLYAAQAGVAWYVNFSDGNSNDPTVVNAAWVRCVR